MVKVDWGKFLNVHGKHADKVVWNYGRLYCKKCNCYSRFIDSDEK
jgi:hypothetical protein